MLSYGNMMQSSKKWGLSHMQMNGRGVGGGGGTRRDIGRELPVPLTLFDVTHPGPGLRAVKIFKF